MPIFKKKKTKVEKEEDTAAKVEAPTPPKKDIAKVDPRMVLQQHKDKVMELIRLEAEFNYLVTDGKYKAVYLRKEVEQMGELLLKAGYSKDQVEENISEAQKMLDGAYEE